MLNGSVLQQKRRRRGQRIAAEPRPGQAWLIVIVAGGALALVGWTDALLLWFPAGFGDPEWEFATSSTFFDAVPLGTIGLIALTAGGLNRSSRPVLIPLAVVFPLLTLFFVAAAVLFLLSAVAAWSAVDPAYRPVLERVVVKTSILSATYCALYAWLTWTVNRRSERKAT